MVALTHLLLLSSNLLLLSHVYANEESTSEAVKWLQAERSVLVHLATPDLHFWNQRDRIATHYPGAFIFNFTLAPDNLTLFLNNEPILPRIHPHVPPPLRAPQTGETTTQFAHQVCTNYTGAPVMDLDYYIEAPDTTSSTSIYNTKYNPRIRLDILRAHIPTYPGYSTPLSSNVQNQIWVYLADLSAHPPDTPYSRIPLRIEGVEVDGRWLDYSAGTYTGGTTTYKTLKSLKTCYFWSWLCADVKGYPYYEYIYRENFDEYGKKGSMRHFVTKRWAVLVGLVGIVQATMMLAVCGALALWPFVYAVFRGVKSVIEGYRERMKEVDEWLADEEVEGEGLLENDEFLEEDLDFRGLEKEKGGEKTSVEEFLSPPPFI